MFKWVSKPASATHGGQVAYLELRRRQLDRVRLDLPGRRRHAQHDIDERRSQRVAVRRRQPHAERPVKADQLPQTQRARHRRGATAAAHQLAVLLRAQSRPSKNGIVTLR